MTRPPLNLVVLTGSDRPEVQRASQTLLPRLNESAGIDVVGEYPRSKDIDDSLDGAQRETLDTLLPLAFAFFVDGALSIERVPLSVNRTDDLITITTPASQVEMKPLAGLDGARIRVSGLPSNSFHDYVQYESVRHVHNGPNHQWSHSGTNGFTSRMIANSVSG